MAAPISLAEANESRGALVPGPRRLADTSPYRNPAAFLVSNFVLTFRLYRDGLFEIDALSVFDSAACFAAAVPFSTLHSAYGALVAAALLQGGKALKLRWIRGCLYMVAGDFAGEAFSSLDLVVPLAPGQPCHPASSLRVQVDLLAYFIAKLQENTLELAAQLNPTPAGPPGGAGAGAGGAGDAGAGGAGAPGGAPGAA